MTLFKLFLLEISIFLSVRELYLFSLLFELMLELELFPFKDKDFIIFKFLNLYFDIEFSSDLIVSSLIFESKFCRLDLRCLDS